MKCPNCSNEMKYVGFTGNNYGIYECVPEQWSEGCGRKFAIKEIEY